jgi:hypothetical protein
MMTPATQEIAKNPFAILLAAQTKLLESLSFQQQEMLSDTMANWKPVDDALKVAKQIMNCNPPIGPLLDNLRLIVGYSMRNTPHDTTLALEVAGCPSSGADLKEEAFQLLLAWSQRNLPPVQEKAQEAIPFADGDTHDMDKGADA